MQTKDIPSPDYLTVGQFIHELEQLLRAGAISWEHTVPVVRGGVRFIGTQGDNQRADITFSGDRLTRMETP